MLQVGTDARLYGNDGERVYLRGIHLFDPCFGAFNEGYRTNWLVRYYLYPDTPPSTSPPVGPLWSDTFPTDTALGYIYVDDATARQKIVDVKSLGFNTIRFFVDPAFSNTASFTDEATGVTFPSEPEIVDKIVGWASELGMYVWITNANPSVPNTDTATFWGWMGDHYKDADNVIFDLQNEPGSSDAAVFIDSANPTTSTTYDLVMTDLAHWTARMGPCLTAIRDAGFQGPVAVQPYANLWSIETISDALDYSGNPFLTDPNLIIAPHIFYFHQDDPTDFTATDLPGLTRYVTNYAKYWCVVAGIFGFTNGYEYTTPTSVNAAIAWNKKAASWLMREHMNGAIFFTDRHLYSPGDLNNIFATASSFTGSISGTTLTVSDLQYWPAISRACQGRIPLNGQITGAGVANGTKIDHQLTGSPAGGNGTYQVTISQTVASTAMEAHILQDDLSKTYTTWGDILTQYNVAADGAMATYEPIVGATV